MKSITVIALITIGLLPGLKAQQTTFEDLPFTEVALNYNTMNDKNQLMHARSVVRFDPLNELCLESPVTVMFEKNAEDMKKKYVLYQWDASLRRWVKTKTTKLGSVACGTHDYYAALLSCKGVYGVFEEINTTKHTEFSLPKNYRIHKMKYIQENTGVVFEWDNRAGQQKVVIPFGDLSSLGVLHLEITDGKMVKSVIHDFKLGHIVYRKINEDGVTLLSMDEKLIKQTISSQTLNASK